MCPKQPPFFQVLFKIPIFIEYFGQGYMCCLLLLCGCPAEYPTITHSVASVVSGYVNFGMDEVVDFKSLRHPVDISFLYVFSCPYVSLTPPVLN